MNTTLPRKRIRLPRRQSAAAAVSKSSDLDSAADSDPTHSHHQSGPSRSPTTLNKLVLGKSKILGKASDLPSEERPFRDFFPDLDIVASLPIVKFDYGAEATAADATTDSTSHASMTSDKNGSAVKRHALQLVVKPLDDPDDQDPATGVSAPFLDTLPALSKEAFKTVPKPSFRMLQNADSQNVVAPLEPFARYIDPSEDELAERIEYDMDEQDREWLIAFNIDRKRMSQRPCSEDLFERLIDHIEKEWFDLTKDLPKAGRDETPYPEDISCAVCDDGEAENSNAIVFCDGCNLAVHQDCYGVPFIPEGQWLCRKCMVSPEMPVSCVFCPLEGGAFKQTSTNRWAHLSCAMWIPECHIANTVYMEPIEGVENIPKSRWKLRYGAPIQCSNKSCFTAFHPSCARKAKLYMKMRGQNSADPNNFRAYCDKHSPREYRETVDLESTVFAAQQELGRLKEPRRSTMQYTSGGFESDDDRHSTVSYASSAQRKRKAQFEASDDERSEAAFITSKSRPKQTIQINSNQPRAAASASSSSLQNSVPGYSSPPNVSRPIISMSAPVIPMYVFSRVLESVEAQLPKKKPEIAIKVARYWALKRENRRGAALLKRLHLEPWTAMATANKEDEENKIRKYELLGQLRRDLERVRMLTDLVRKREKEKERICLLQQQYIMMLLNPIAKPLRAALDQLKAKDRYKIFAEPVSIIDVPDYLNYISHPMDFATMADKIDSFQYMTVDDFE
eukprot:jgi/Hompol1/5941/HPOL_004751-RA